MLNWKVKKNLNINLYKLEPFKYVHSIYIPSTNQLLLVNLMHVAKACKLARAGVSNLFNQLANLNLKIFWHKVTLIIK